MTETLTPPQAKNVVSDIPDIATVYKAYRRFRYAESELWKPHYDSHHTPRGELAAPFVDADRLLQSLDTLAGAEGQFDRTEYPWLPQESEVIFHAVNVAENIRRSYSPDAYFITNSIVPGEPTSLSESALAHARLRGSHDSVASKDVRYAKIYGDFKGLTPMLSDRRYQEVTVADIDALASEEAIGFVQLASDILAPVRNSYQPLSAESLVKLTDIISQRSDEIGSLSPVLLLCAWRIAWQNDDRETADTILTHIDKGSPLHHFMTLYEPTEAKSIEPEILSENASRFEEEYIDDGHSLEEIKDIEKPKLRMRIKPDALWSIAMRHGGALWPGDKGTGLRSTGRGHATNSNTYALIRRRVEETIFGPAASDTVLDVPINYGYYTDKQDGLTLAARSTVRIYGDVELVFKDDIDVQKQAVYGDTMNAVAVAGIEEGVSALERPGLIEEVVGARLIPESEVGELARIIAELHGNEENTEFNPSANPYIECLIRGRLNLSDCESIIVPQRVIDASPELVETIQTMYGVRVILEEQRG